MSTTPDDGIVQFFCPDCSGDVFRVAATTNPDTVDTTVGTMPGGRLLVQCAACEGFQADGRDVLTATLAKAPE